MLKTNIKSTQEEPQMENCSKTGQKSFQYRRVHTWNSLSVDARDYCLDQFKKYVAGTVCK